MKTGSGIFVSPTGKRICNTIAHLLDFNHFVCVFRCFEVHWIRQYGTHCLGYFWCFLDGKSIYDHVWRIYCWFF